MRDHEGPDDVQTEAKQPTEGSSERRPRLLKDALPHVPIRQPAAPGEELSPTPPPQNTDPWDGELLDVEDNPADPSTGGPTSRGYERFERDRYIGGR